MGFDLHGMGPKDNKHISKYDVYGKYSDLDWSERNDILEKNPEIQKEYWKQMDEYQDANPGRYFRNNVWWWRPLWDYVCDACQDILEEEDWNRGHYNDNHLIDEEKSIAIADILDRELENGDTDKYKELYDDQIKELSKKDKFESSYPFEIDNVKRFALFCRESGGFTIG
jgi:hypothetical protein